MTDSDSSPPSTVDGGDDLPPRELTLRFRSAFGAPPPRRIRMQVPGWTGSSSKPVDGGSPQPWHCRPFVDGATYGMELLYPYRSECRVSRDADAGASGGAGAVRFGGTLDAEMAERGLPHPFGVFAPGHYGMATALDLLPPAGYALRLEPHPRFFTEKSGDVPIAVPGHLQRFWPRQFFAVFRAPAMGEVHVFRPGEPYAQLLLVPDGQAYELREMEPELAADRANQDRQITTLAYLLATKIWRSEGDHWFDDKYKRLLRLFRTGGLAAVRKRLQAVDDLVNRRSVGKGPGAT